MLDPRVVKEYRKEIIRKMVQKWGSLQEEEEWQNIIEDNWCKEKNREIKNGMMTNVAKS